MSRTQYLIELESVRQNLIKMGETTVALFGEALCALMEPNSGARERSREFESQIDHQHGLIHDQCLSLITRQAPVASDARLVTGVLDAIVDLELIGDYAYEIACASMRRRPPAQVLAQISDVGAKTRETLAIAVDCWRRDARTRVPPVRARGAAIQAECRTLYEKISQLTSMPGDATTFVDLMLICRHFERILRHAVCVAEQAAEAAPLHDERPSEDISRQI